MEHVEGQGWTEESVQRPRVVGWLAVVALVASVWWDDGRSPAVWVGLVFAGLVLPQLEGALLRARGHAPGLTRATLYVDALALGALMPLIDFQPLPSVSFVVVLLLIALPYGGADFYLRCVAAQASGALGVAAVVGPRLDVAHSPATVLASLAVLVGYGVAASVLTADSAALVRAQRLDLEARNAALATAQANLRERVAEVDALKRGLERYVEPGLLHSLSSGQIRATVESERRDLTVMFSDIRGFTEIAASMEPEPLTALLNEYLTEMEVVVRIYGGTFDKFIGDALMVYFGDRTQRPRRLSAAACAAMALEMQARLVGLRERWTERGLPELHVRIGLASGPCVVGNFGSESRLEYTIIGTPPNLASRIQGAASPDEVWVCAETAARLSGSAVLETKGQVQAKGFDERVQVFRVLGMVLQSDTPESAIPNLILDGATPAPARRIDRSGR